MTFCSAYIVLYNLLICPLSRNARNITLGPLYEEETCIKQKCHPRTQDITWASQLLLIISFLTQLAEPYTRETS